MKKIFILLLITISSISIAQEKSITTKVESATIFLNSAQVTRSKQVQLIKGVQFLKFINLSPFVDKKSIQIKANDIEIQAINFQKDYLAKSKKSEEYNSLEKKINNLSNKTDIEQVALSTIQEEMQFLKSNRSIRGNTTLTVSALRETAQFYSAQVKLLKTKELSLKNKIIQLKVDQKKVQKQMNDLSTEKEFAPGEILLKIKSNSQRTVNFELTYNVSNVSWYPSYDIRVKDIESPLELVYKANLKQNSQADWNNVKLRFSSANPSRSTKAGKIKPYFLDFGSVPPYYGSTISEVSGYVGDISGGLPGANVMIKGTTIGTTTDYDGKYSIKVPENASTLTFSYLGYETVSRFINSPVINVELQESAGALEEVVITGYSNDNKRKKQSKKELLLEKTPGLEIRKSYDSDIQTVNVIQQTSVSFEIVEPYSIKSSNKDFMVSMETYQSDAEYMYYTVPKIEENVFLVASLKGWEKYSLLEGEANVYFENTFIGTSLIDTRKAEGKLDISLGMDKNISIQRKKSKDYTTKQFIGSKKEETRVWDFIVKNNKTQKIQMTVLDQIPVSTKEEIRVTLDKSFTGNIDKETGEVAWKFILDSKTSKKLQLKYSVRSPKNSRIVID